MPKPEKDFFEDMMAKMVALPIIGVVYVVFRFWRVIPRALSFTGSWLLVLLLLVVPTYSIPIWFEIYAPEIGWYMFPYIFPFIIPTFPVFCVALVVMFKRGMKASINSWIFALLILYTSISYYYNPLDFDYQTPLFVAFCVAVYTTTRNTIRVIRQPAQLEKRFEAVRGVFFGTVPYHRKEMPVIRPIKDDGHVLVIGGAGSGKSSCIAIPTLKKYWDGRFLAVDIKGELAEKSGRNALIFNPTTLTRMDMTRSIWHVRLTIQLLISAILP